MSCLWACGEWTVVSSHIPASSRSKRQWPDACSLWIIVLSTFVLMVLSPSITYAQSTNTPPVANAGVDQNAEWGTLVRLDGSLSYDPDGDTISYSWQVIAPRPDVVSLQNSNTPRPTFTAPVAPSCGEHRLTVQLVLTDGQLNSEPDTVDVIFPTLPPCPTPPTRIISVVTDKQSYQIGEVIQFTINTNYSVEASGLLQILQPNNQVYSEREFYPRNYGNPVPVLCCKDILDVELTGLASSSGTWTARASHGTLTAETTFELEASPSLVTGQTIKKFDPAQTIVKTKAFKIAVIGEGVKNLQFMPQTKTIVINNDGSAGPIELEIPKGLLTGQFIVMADGKPVDFVKSDTQVGATLLMEKPAGSSTITIQGSSGPQAPAGMKFSNIVTKDVIKSLSGKTPDYLSAADQSITASITGQEAGSALYEIDLLYEPIQDEFPYALIGIFGGVGVGIFFGVYAIINRKDRISNMG